MIFSYDDATCMEGDPFQVCGSLFLDVNGPHSPNLVGKDIYGIHLLQNSIKPGGTTGDGMDTYNSCSADSDGWACATNYLMNK
jgi:hypothetical protein